MAGLLPATHDFLYRITEDVGGRAKPGHDTKLQPDRRHAFDTFQNTGTAPFNRPERLLRHAAGGRVWARWKNRTVSNARIWISASSFLRCASSVVSIHAERMSSIFSSLG